MIDRLLADRSHAADFEFFNRGGCDPCERHIPAEMLFDAPESYFGVRAVGAVVDLTVLPVFIESLTERDILRNEVVIPCAFLDCCHFSRPESLSFLQIPEALSFPDLIGIANLNQISIELLIPNPTRRKISVLFHESVFTPFHGDYVG